MIIKQDDFSALINKNHELVALYTDGILIKLVRDAGVSHVRQRQHLLDALQVISDYFQKIIFLRTVLTDDASFKLPVLQHLKEEFGHNEALMQERNHRPPVWDAILESTCSWFAWKMFTSNDEERLVLVHLVLETAANVFFQSVHSTLGEGERKGYIDTHAVVDDEHAHLGINLLQDLSERKYARLLSLQAQGWDVMTAASDRIAYLVRSSMGNTQVQLSGA